MKDRSDMVDWIRGEIVGPSKSDKEPSLIRFSERDFADEVSLRRGPLAWLPPLESVPQEVLYYERESPHRKYGAGVLHPAWSHSANPAPDDAALQATDTVGIEKEDDNDEIAAEESSIVGAKLDDLANDSSEDFEVTSADLRHPSTIGISFCVKLDASGKLVVRAPQSRKFSWQAEDASAVQVNGRYESCNRKWLNKDGDDRESPMWRRLSAVGTDSYVTFDASDFASRRALKKVLPLPDNSPVRLGIEIFPRRFKDRDDTWIVTAVMRNTADSTGGSEREAVLYQAFFEVATRGGQFEPYPESTRAFEKLDDDEQSLALLYRAAGTWAVGHGCAASWDAPDNGAPTSIFGDPMPVAELPSMTPIIEVEGRPIELLMGDLSRLPDEGVGGAWSALQDLSDAYAKWILGQRKIITNLPAHLAPVANRHLDGCEACLCRIKHGIELLKSDAKVRTAFRLANLAMLLQQISTKRIEKRPLIWDSAARLVIPKGPHVSPWSKHEGAPPVGFGSWRAFQMAFLLMSLDGVRSWKSTSREIVDLIWFPTGGGKTEAYLALMAFYMFHERLLGNTADVRRDGTNVLMRYTLRMLTTQQFQRAASLICAMEYLRRRPADHSICEIPGRRFSLGLWIGQQGSPNSIDQAKSQLSEFRRGVTDGNPLVLTDCPWCRAEIGRYRGPKPQSIRKSDWNAMATRGVVNHDAEGPLLLCTDSSCEFGSEQVERWLPVEVIDERIYAYPPSLVIATVDKFAMVAYRPLAGSLFGRQLVGGSARQVSFPPGLIVQDELHLISGPLGSMYAIYEGVFERLCSSRHENSWIKPKIIASTATIRGAADQVKTLYARSETTLFPSPALEMGDSFFGRYARSPDGSLSPGRMYVGVHASDYGSVLTTQVRTFSTALFRSWSYPEGRRDPWWTLLAFYNSIRELGGAKTLFDSDIRSRLKFLFNREGYAQDDRRTLRIVEELTSRLTQSDIVQMMDRLSTPYSSKGTGVLDACLASNIIEVGVDIDRLSLMGVVGQPKTTSTYIQVTGRVGRKWSERPGLILVIYNPSKSRDRSHFEQFLSYHRRLYERVEPTSATPFAISAIQRALPGALLVWARQQSAMPVQNLSAYSPSILEAGRILADRCRTVQIPEDEARSLRELQRVQAELLWKWQQNPQKWEAFPPRPDGEYLMLWPGQFQTPLQKQHGVNVPSSMRQVDGSAELTITQGYVLASANAGDQGADPDGAAVPTINNDGIP
jgi:Helicase conserved C-terminal domain